MGWTVTAVEPIPREKAMPKDWVSEIVTTAVCWTLCIAGIVMVLGFLANTITGGN
jgi:hypothetical protein